MDNSVLMLLFLGCFPLVIFQASGVKCRLCDKYFNGECTTKYTTCNAKNGELCRHFRISDTNNMSHISFGYSDCSDQCSPYYSSGYSRAYLLFCCNDSDLCNDDTVPVDHYMKNLFRAMSVSLP